MPASVWRAGEHHQVSISAAAFDEPGPLVSTAFRNGLVRPGNSATLLRTSVVDIGSLRLHLRPCSSHSDGVYPSRQSDSEREPATVGEFMRRMVGAGGTTPGKDRRFQHLRRNVLPGTSEQTQDIANFVPRGAGSCCGTGSVTV